MKKSISLVLVMTMLLSVIAPFAGVISAFADGTEENIALGKNAMGPGSNVASITDGQKTTASFWDGGVAPAEAIIDLGGYYDITKVNVITYFGDGRYYHYSVEISDNGLLYEKVSEKDNNDVATANGFDHDFEKTGRYVKIKMTKNSNNPSVHLVEVSVYGKENLKYEPKPVEGNDPNDPDNIAFYKPTRSNSSASISAAANDGDIATVWKGEDYPKYVDIDLLANYDISKIVLFTPQVVEYAYDIYGSLDGVSFTRLVSSDGMVKCPKEGMIFEFDNISYRIIRVNITANSKGSGAGAEISDVKIYGKKNDSQIVPTRKTIEFTSYETWLKDKHGVDLSKIKDANGRYDIDATYTEADTIKEVQGIVTRILGEKYNEWFIFDVDPDGNSDKSKDYFKIEDSGSKIKISGSDGTCIAAGLNWYLKYYCNVHVSQQTETVKMPDAVVKVGEKVFYETAQLVRYAYNYCTLSYTMAFFGYDDWRRELDWLMLNGVNLVLDITATEALWVHYLQRLGYTVDQAKDYVCGYAFKAWWLMGNLENYGGSVSDQWVYDTLEMARVNQRSLTVMGAEPALQTFVGAMPASFGTLAKAHLLDKGYGDVSKSLAAQGAWSGFTRPNVLRTDYDGYSYLAQMFYDSQNYIYGQVTDYYCGDVCHEGGIIPAGLAKEDMAAKILDECLAADEDAIWMLQVWWDNPMKGVLDGFGDKKNDHVILLDLAAAHSPKYTNTTTWGGAEYGGTNWIFCTLDNYGGRAGMHGKLKLMCELIVTAKNKSNYMKGIGITPEGTQNNPVMMELYWEMIWRDETPNLNEWIEDYSARRYGKSNSNVIAAWKQLLISVYKDGSYDGTTINYSVSGRPQVSGYEGGYYVQTYANVKLYNIIKTMMKAFDDLKDNESYIYDLVDMMRTYLSNQCTEYLSEIKKLAAATKDTERSSKYEILYKKYLDGMLLIDELSAYSKDELLGTWIGRVDNWINDERTGEYDDYTADTMEFNAKCLISAWCSRSLIDYANRQYNGFMHDYYYQAWKTFLEGLVKPMKLTKNLTSYSLEGAKYFRYAWDFIINDVEYSSEVLNANGDEKSRGIEALFNKIMLNHSSSGMSTPLVEFGFTTESGYTSDMGILSGVEDNTTVEKLASNLTIEEGTVVTVYDASGKKLSTGDVVSSGCRVVLSTGNSTADVVVIGGTIPAQPVTELPTEEPTATQTLESTEQPDTTPADTTDAEDADNNSVVVIVIVAVAVAVVIGVAVTLVIIKKRK